MKNFAKDLITSYNKKSICDTELLNLIAKLIQDHNIKLDAKQDATIQAILLCWINNAIELRSHVSKLTANIGLMFANMICLNALITLIILSFIKVYYKL